MTIHFHGTPFTPRATLYDMAGKHFCVPFSEPRDADVCLQIGQSVMFDNGAFKKKTQGVETAWGDLYDWLEPRLAPPHWAVIPDVIDGDVEQQRALVAQWPYRGLGAPVWHMALPIDYLLELAEKWPRVCFGSSGQFWVVGSESWCRRADEAFDALERRGHLRFLAVHMLRGLALCGDRWPFASADSVNVARNHAGNNTRETPAVDPERMARRIDSIQCPARWSPRVEQKELFA